MERLLTLDEVEIILQKPRKWIYTQIQNNKFERVVRLTGLQGVRIPESSLEAYIESRTS